MRVDWLQTTGMSSSSANAYRVANELSHGGQDFNPVGGWGSRVRVPTRRGPIGQAFQPCTGTSFEQRR